MRGILFSLFCVFKDGDFVSVNKNAEKSNCNGCSFLGLLKSKMATKKALTYR